MQNSLNSEQGKYMYAGFWVRTAAYLIDSAIIFLGLLAVRLILILPDLVFGNAFNRSILFTYSMKDIIIYLCGALYFVLCTYYKGTTIGKKMMNLQVINADGTTQLSFINVLYRETVGRFLSKILLCAGYIVIGFDSEKRGFHDMLCDTRVVFVCRNLNTQDQEEKSQPDGSYTYIGENYSTLQDDITEELESENNQEDI